MIINSSYSDLASSAIVSYDASRDQ